MSMIEINSCSHDLQKFLKGVALRQTVAFGAEITRNNGGEIPVGGNEHGATDQILVRIDLLRLPPERISARQIGVYLVRGMTSIAVTGHVNEIASQTNQGRDSCL